MNDDELDRNPNYAAVVFTSAALAIGAQIIWNVPILLTAMLSFPLVMWFFRPAFGVVSIELDPPEGWPAAITLGPSAGNLRLLS
jgi:hypothetical protein